MTELTAHDLELYAFRAMTTVGDVDDFRHFLPRILELLPHDFPVDKEVVLSKLKYAGWAQWPPAERAAVKRFLVDLWAWARHKAPDPYPYIPTEIGSWLCAIARAELDVTGYLADWANDADIEARENLQRFLGDHRAELMATYRRAHIGRTPVLNGSKSSSGLAVSKPDDHADRDTRCLRMDSRT